MAHRWYVVHVHSTFEQKVAEYIKDKAILKGLAEKFDEILVPTEEVVDVKNGKKKTKEKRLFPGYMLVRMEMTDETWRLVSDNSKVTGFLGAGNRPSPISDTEAKLLINQMEEGAASPRASVEYFIGEQVRVIEGPFAGFEATVDDVDAIHARLRVTVKIFERDTPVDLEYKQVDKN